MKTCVLIDVFLFAQSHVLIIKITKIIKNPHHPAKQMGKKKHTNHSRSTVSQYSSADAVMDAIIKQEMARNAATEPRADSVLFGFLALAGLIVVSFAPAAWKAWRHGLASSHSLPGF